MAHQAEKEKQCREVKEEEKPIWKSVIQLDKMHEGYENLLKDAKKRLERIYESKDGGDDMGDGGDEVNEDVVRIFQERMAKEWSDAD
ncbi:hypothetical protein SESBI_40258 [Sesbania bispinosa]|nr:hypothetical protein SESBI_40258 [Sesbania bispinosa]